jgi:hypothetical protein
MRTLNASAALMVTFMCGVASGQSSTAATPACAASAPEHFASYLTDSDSKLKSEVLSLQGIKFAGAKDQDESAAVLAQTGAFIQEMLPRIPNLEAHEQLSQISVALPYVVSETTRDGPSQNNQNRYAIPQVSSVSHSLEGKDLDKALHNMGTAKSHTVFTYRIHPEQDPAVGTVLEEFRTDSDGVSVDIDYSKPGNPHGIGFSDSWLLFVPANQSESKFRFLGHQKIDGHSTVVLAFAQLPEHVRLPAEIEVDGGSCPFFTQGLAWIDASNFHIVRIETDLLFPIPGIQLTEMRSEVRFGDVLTIPERNLSLRLPTDTGIFWKTTTSAGAEFHHYSDYRLFTATSTIVTNPPD